MRAALLACLTGVITSGCILPPHFESLTPAFDGIVTRNGRPASGARIKLSADASPECVEALSKEDGTFRLDAVRRFRWFSVFWPLPADPDFGWSLWVDDGTQFQLADRSRGVGYPPATRSVTFELDPARSAR